MDVLPIIIRGVAILLPLMHHSPPPRVDYSSLLSSTSSGALKENLEPQAAALPAQFPPMLPRPSIPMPQVLSHMKVRQPLSPERASTDDRQRTGCIPCSRSHLSTVSGALGESLRFAREGGIEHPEVQRRLNLAEDEINVMERIDLAPDALAASPEDQQQLAKEYLPRIRRLRQDLGEVTSVERLEKAAVDASVLGQEFRLRHLQLQGVDLNPVLQLAQKVQAGEMTIDEAKARLKEMLPKEES